MAEGDSLTVLQDLAERLRKADQELCEMADNRPDLDNHYYRLSGKAQGVRMALGYVEEAIRGT